MNLTLNSKYSNKKYFFVFICFFVFSVKWSLIYSQNQKTVVLKVKQDTWIDNRPAEINRNFEFDKKLEIRSLTYSGTPGTARSLVEFEFDSLPKGAQVKSAYLSLYYYLDTPQSHYQRGENGFEIRRIVSPWDAKSITWTNKNYLLDVNKAVFVDASVSPSQSYPSIDITNLVVDYLKDSLSSGFEMRLTTELPQRAVFLCSSKHPNVSFHPTLTIVYELPTKVESIPADIFNISYFDRKINIRSNSAVDYYNEMQVCIYDFAGNLLFSKNCMLSESNECLLDVSEVALGYYFVQIKVSGRVYRKKVFFN